MFYLNNNILIFMHIVWGEMNNKLKHEFLTKEVLERDYEKLGSFKLIAEKYGLPSSTIQRYCKEVFKIETKSKAYYVNHDVFSQDNEESFYWAGFIAADGCVLSHKSEEPNNIVVCLSKNDERHLLKLRKFLEFDGPIHTEIKKLSEKNGNWNDVKQVRLNIYSKQIIEDLNKFGIGQRKSLTYNFPKNLSNHQLISHFMRGYNDGDGSFYNTTEKYFTKKYGEKYFQRIHFSLRGTLEFLKEYKRILENNGLISIVDPIENNGIGQLHINGYKNVSCIAKFLYSNANIFLERKYDKVKDLL